MAISKETVEHVAHLARMELQPNELGKLSRQLEDILSFIDKLKRIDTQDILATSHILPIHNVLRKDNPQESLPQEKVLGMAPLREGNFFVVPKVIE
jgi:aspartyl-tRNA(Asn)/glutamyl-tRNA(Gln) amidotransferase subunit C